MHKMSIWSTRFTLFLILFSLWTLNSSLAQDATGKIEGTLRDPQGAVVPNASVTVTNLGTGAKKSAQSDRIGNFALVSLPIGKYRLTVEANNFSKYVREPVTLNVNDTIHLLIDLKLGSPQETIQVTSVAAEVETLSNALGKVTSGREILDLPLNGRNFFAIGTVAGRGGPTHSRTSAGRWCPERGLGLLYQWTPA
jgi:hypothetical protein